MFGLQARGVRVALDGRRVRVTPGHDVTTAECDELREHFHEVRELLAQEQQRVS